MRKRGKAIVTFWKGKEEIMGEGKMRYLLYESKCTIWKYSEQPVIIILSLHEGILFLCFVNKKESSVWQDSYLESFLKYQ